MESDDSPRESRSKPDGESDHASDRESDHASDRESDHASDRESDHASDRTDGETPVGPAGQDAEVSVQDQWHGDPPEGWNEEKDGGVFGAGPEEDEYEPPPIEPGDPSLENALFVLLGVLTSVGLLVHVVVSF